MAEFVPTKSEYLFLERLRSGLTQANFAATKKMRREDYNRLENGWSEILIAVKEVEPTDLEICILKRRRLGMTQDQLAAKLGVSRLWVNLMERGRRRPEALLKFWS